MHVFIGTHVCVCVYVFYKLLLFFIPPPLSPYRPLENEMIKCSPLSPAMAGIPNMESNLNAFDIKVGTEFLIYFSGLNQATEAMWSGVLRWGFLMF